MCRCAGWEVGSVGVLGGEWAVQVCWVGSGQCRCAGWGVISVGVLGGEWAV